MGNKFIGYTPYAVELDIYLIVTGSHGMTQDWHKHHDGVARIHLLPLLGMGIDTYNPS